MNMDDVAMLEPHAVSLRPRVDGNPIGNLSWEDLCFALGCLGDDAPSLLVRAKYGNEAQAARALLRRVRGAVVTLAARRGWNLAVEEISRLSQVSLEVYVIPPLCTVCGGRKEAMIGALLVVCEGCGGSGVVGATDASMAARLGVPVDAWRNIWEGRMAQVLDLLGAWESQASRNIFERTQNLVDTTLENH